MTQPTTLITGANRGIGRAIAQHLAAQGHSVIGLSRTPPEEEFPGDYVACDLADADATQETLDGLVKRHTFTHLVNNAGLLTLGKVGEIDAREFERIMAVNVRATIQCIEACVPAMRAAGRGRIVNIGSRASLGKEGRLVYGTSKAAVTGLTRTAALELARDGITVNCIAPGPIETDMIAVSLPEGSPQRAAFVDKIPAGRMGQVDEIAAAAAYFLSDAAGFTTGQVLYVCGGLSIGGYAL